MTHSVDMLERRCPRLGSVVHFGYCRRIEGEDEKPCSKVLDCWWERFDVAAYLRQNLSVETFDRLTHSAPPNKMADLLTLIEQARQRLDAEK